MVPEDARRLKHSMKEMKKYVCAILLMGFAFLLLAGCEQPENEEPDLTANLEETDTQSRVSIPEGMESVLPGAGGGTEGEASENEPVNEAMQMAEDCVGQEVAALYEVIGMPTDSTYVASCLGAGEDGELYYDGFTVVTYREGDSEIVRGVY